MRKFILIPLLALSSCYTQKSVKSVAKHNGTTMREVASLNLFAGEMETSELSSAKAGPVYLFYRGSNLEYVSTDKAVIKSATGALIYKVQRSGNSAYMLTRDGQLRYFVEDTVLFLKDYAVHSQCLYGGNISNKGEFVQAYFNVYHFSADSLLVFSSQSKKPLLSVSQYGADTIKTRQFIERASLRKLPAISKNDFISTIVR